MRLARLGDEPRDDGVAGLRSLAGGGEPEDRAVRMLVSHRRSVAALLLAVIAGLTTAGCGVIGGKDNNKAKTTTTPLGTLPASTAAPADTSTTAPQEYIVQSGDSLTKIAKMFGVSVAALVAANNIQNADKITEGQRLKIPPATTTTTAGAGPPPGATTTAHAGPPPGATTAPPAPATTVKG
jgi:LysM repeat protein